MYQYVISRDVVPPFSLYLPHPRSVLNLNNDSILPYSDALVIVEAGEQSYDIHVLDVLEDSEVVKFSIIIIIKILHMNMNYWY